MDKKLFSDEDKRMDDDDTENGEEDIIYRWWYILLIPHKSVYVCENVVDWMKFAIIT